MFESAYEVGADTGGLTSLIDYPESGQDLLELDPEGEAGQVDAEAVVLPVGEAEVPVVLAADVVGERAREVVLVPVGGRRPDGHPVSLPQGDASVGGEIPRPEHSCARIHLVCYHGVVMYVPVIARTRSSAGG